jgi:hypothetical protein
MRYKACLSLLPTVRYASHASSARERAEDANAPRLAQSAGSEQDFAGQPAPIRRRQEHCDRSDVAGLADTTKRRLRGDLLLEIAANGAQGVRAFGFDAARIEPAERFLRLASSAPTSR